MRDVVELIHYVTDIEAFMQAGEIRRQFFSPPFPITATVEVVKLYRPELVIEIMTSAEIPLDRFIRPDGMQS